MSDTDDASLPRLRLTWASLSTGLGRAWKVTTVTGLVLVFGYFVRYRYSPIDSLASVGALAGLVATLAILLGVGLFVTWTYPTGLLWGLATSGAAPQLREVFGVPAPEFQGPPRPVHQRFGRLALVGASWVLFPWMAMFAASMPAAFGGEGLHVCVAGAFTALAFAGWCVLLHGRATSTPVLLRGLLVLLAVVLLVGPLIAFLQLVTVGPFAHDDDGFHVVSIVAVVGTVLALEVALHGYWFLRTDGPATRHARTQVGWLAGAFVLLMIGLGAAGGMLDNVMAAASVRVPDARLVLAPEACEALDMLAGTPAPAASSPAQPRPCLLQKVLVVSRIGERWRLGCPDQDRFGIVIDAKQVRAWAPADRKALPDARVDKVCGTAGAQNP
jgi:hypothetical protein